MSGSVSVAKDDTLNTSFAEYLAFSLILLIFYRCPVNSVVPRAPDIRNLGGGAPAPTSCMAPAPMVWQVCELTATADDVRVPHTNLRT